MRCKTLFLSAVLVQGLFAAATYGRGGGGCFADGTPIRIPGGVTAIENLGIGSQVVVPAGREERTGTVCSVTAFKPGAALALTIAGQCLTVTESHPFQTAPGVFVEAGCLKKGDAVCIRDEAGIHSARIESVRRVSSAARFHNILVMPGGIYVAGSAIVHNKGCFLPDTPITKADGKAVRISEIKAGDKILAFDKRGDIQSAAVLGVTTQKADGYLVVATDRIILNVTSEHPFYVGGGVFKTIGALQTNDIVFAYDGSGLSAQKIRRIEAVAGAVTVYNLRTDAPNTFFANGIAVHNKGGGCFADGTPIRIPGGTTAIENLGIGNRVVVPAGREERTGTVCSVIAYEPGSALALTIAGQCLTVTESHPFQTAPGVFVEAGCLKKGEAVCIRDEAGTHSARIESVRRVQSAGRFHNILVMPGGIYVAGSAIVHNKGCFLPDTPITKADGKAVRISEIKAGDKILAFDKRGDIQSAAVLGVTTQKADGYLVVAMDRIILSVTSEHPFYVGGGVFKTIGALRTNDVVFAYDGSGLSAQKIRRIEAVAGAVTVYNLRTDAPNTFFANGIAVHNKGGGGFHGSSGGRRSGGGGDADPKVMMVFFGLFAAVMIIVLIKSKRQQAKENLDYVFSRGRIERKAAQTRKLLEFIAKVDRNFEPGKLTALAKDVFMKLQDCWQAREYEPMKPLMMPDLYVEHDRQLAAMKRQHEINKMDSIRIDAVDLVNVRYPHDPAQREFTALITATIRDYYVDDRDGKFLRGDSAAETFQEFWTFQWRENKWALRDIEQTKESDALKEENFFEQFTNVGVEQVYGEAAGAGGPAGPLLEDEVLQKTNKIDRLLNFLARTDNRIWNRQAMIKRAREVFISVKLYEQTGKPSDLKENLIDARIAEALKKEVSGKIAAGYRLELRNLCIRKVELVLVRNYAADKMDEYTVRIRAHAQQVVKRGEEVVRQDDDVAPFEEYWSFGRYGTDWKLKQVLPAAEGRKAVSEENLDQDSSPEMLQWYYTQGRAN